MDEGRDAKKGRVKTEGKQLFGQQRDQEANEESLFCRQF